MKSIAFEPERGDTCAQSYVVQHGATRKVQENNGKLGIRFIKNKRRIRSGTITVKCCVLVTLKDDTDTLLYCTNSYLTTFADRKRQSISNPKTNVTKFRRPQQCAVCNRAVYVNEQQVWGIRVYHRGSCFRCRLCHNPLNDSTVAENCVAEPFCRPCWSGKPGCRSVVTNASVTSCTVCKQPCDAFKLDTILVASLPYHRSCLHCFVCGSQSDADRLVMVDGKPNCRACGRKKTGSDLRCAACDQDASIHELVNLLGAVYHTRCVKCGKYFSIELWSLLNTE